MTSQLPLPYDSPRAPLIVNYGGGVDSTAVLVEFADPTASCPT